MEFELGCHSTALSLLAPFQSQPPRDELNLESSNIAEVPLVLPEPEAWGWLKQVTSPD